MATQRQHDLFRMLQSMGQGTGWRQEQQGYGAANALAQQQASMNDSIRREQYVMAQCPQPKPTGECMCCGEPMFMGRDWCGKAEVNLRSWGHTVIDGVIHYAQRPADRDASHDGEGVPPGTER